MTAGVLETNTARPTTPGSRLNTRAQRAWLMTMPGVSADVVSSEEVRSRPAAARTRNVSKQPPLMIAPAATCVTSPDTMLALTFRVAQDAANSPGAFVNDWKSANDVEPYWPPSREEV